MPTPNNTVSLLIAGKTHSQWTDYDIDSDLLTPADDFQVTLGRPVDAKPDAVQPGDSVEVRVGEDTVLSGRIDRVSTTTAKGQKTLTISGRDDAGILLDCSCPIFNAQDMDLKQIIDTIVKPLGISKIRIDAAQTARTNKVQIEPGSRAWDALAQYAEANGLWPWLEPDGTLVIGGPDYTAKPVADLIVRVSGQGNNVEQLQVERDFSQRFSEITVLGQSHSGKHNLRTTVKDDTVKVHRPLIIVEADVDGPGSGGVHDCLSASVRDGGVRAKTMALPADKWDLFPLPDSINEHGRLDRLYRHTVSQPYDWFGALGVVFKTRQRGDKWFCSEWCAAALGLPESWRWSPNDLAAIVPALYKQETQ